MTAKLQQRQRERDGPAHTERGSVTRSNAALTYTLRVNLREASWTTVAKRSGDTAFARTPRSQSPRAKPPALFVILLAGRASASTFLPILLLFA